MSSREQSAGRTAPVEGKGFGLTAAVALLLIAATLLALPGEAGAGKCGGSVPCRCGDTVTASYTLSEDLGPCSGHGLIVQSHVRLDCGGLKIQGLGNGSEQYGVFLRGKDGAEVTGVTVRRCTVTGFLRGIRLRSASRNTLAENVASGNGNFNTHVGYGIDLTRSPSNALHANTVEGNADEGIHIGPGSHRSRLTENVVTDNYRENLYVLGANDGVFLKNTIGGAGVNSLYLKDSSSNHFEGNTFLGKTARVIGDSRENRFLDNTFSGAGLHFQYYKAAPTRHPARNRVTGGAIIGAQTCLRFTSTQGNEVADTAFRDCKTEILSEAPAGPSDNTIVGSEPVRVTLDERSTVRVGWRLAVQVQDPGGAPLGGVQVTALDASGAAMFTALTDEKGGIPAQVVTASVRRGKTVTSTTSVTITATKAGYAAEKRTVPITRHLTLTIVLKPE